MIASTDGLDSNSNSNSEEQRESSSGTSSTTPVHFLSSPERATPAEEDMIDSTSTNKSESTIESAAAAENSNDETNLKAATSATEDHNNVVEDQQTNNLESAATAAAAIPKMDAPPQVSPRAATTTTTTGDSINSNSAAATQPSMDTPPKKVSPLILSRHEWLQEQENLRKRQSISEEDVRRLKEQNMMLSRRQNASTSNLNYYNPQSNEDCGSDHLPPQQSHSDDVEDVHSDVSASFSSFSYINLPSDNRPTTSSLLSSSVKDLASRFSGLSPISSPERPTASNRQSRVGDDSNNVMIVIEDVPLNDTPATTSSVRNHGIHNKNKHNDNEDGSWMDHFPSNHSMDQSMDSLDVVDRKFLGDARRHNHTPVHPALVRYNSDATLRHDNTISNSNANANNNHSAEYYYFESTNTNTNNPIAMTEESHSKHHPTTIITPLAQLQVADSEFLGFARSGLLEMTQVMEFVHQIKMDHPRATHIPYAWLIPEQTTATTTTTTTTTTTNEGECENNSTNNSGGPRAPAECSGWEEDGEPEGSTGPFLLEQVRDSRHEKDGVWLFPEEAGGVASDPKNSGTVVVIVRYFGSQLLGVTCGRLSQCYQRVAQLTLHRLFRGCHVPLHLDFTKIAPFHTASTTASDASNNANLYGLGGGDTELHLNVVLEDRDFVMPSLLQELDFGGFKGAHGEVLPRLQNLQADFYQYDSTTNAPVVSNTGTIIPVYRYPGNYQGDEWETFEWSPTSLTVKEKVEATLPHFYNDQRMNHCVTNYYRHAHDYIAHHSDKDLDLDQKGAIVSVSIGAERILELRRRAEPRDLTRVVLPHGSMLLLGPATNQQFTHSILPAVCDADDNAEDCVDVGRFFDVIDADARISLTLRHVTTYMDTRTKRLFGQGVDCKTLQDLRRSQRWESIYFVLGFGSLWNYWWLSLSEHPTFIRSLPWPQWLVPYSSSTTTNSRSDRARAIQSTVQDGVFFLGTVAITRWSYSSLWRMYHKRKEENAARNFFTRTSTSGTKY